MFHYYISFFFLLFGSNILVFNAALLLLGYITVMSAVLCVDRLYGNRIVTYTCALVLNLFPLHYMHIFMGHRYAIVAPLSMVSLCLLYYGWHNRSYTQLLASSYAAALAVGSGVMGKQFLASLVVGALLAILLGKVQWKSSQVIFSAMVWLLGFGVAATPLIAYIAFEPELYFLREGGLLRDFMQHIQLDGLGAIRTYASAVYEIFFASASLRRQFLTEFPIIPFSYYPLIVLGLWMLWLHRRYEVVLLSVIPVFGAFVSGAYDFRVLQAVPAWIIAISCGLHAVLRVRRPVWAAVYLGSAQHL